MQLISASVGKGGRNLAADVSTVQRLLAKSGLNPGPVDGICGKRTITAIIAFQGRFLVQPDGRVDPNGQTLRRLNKSSAKVPAPSASSFGQAVTGEEWTGDSSQWPQDKKLRSLAHTFAPKVKSVITALSARGFQPHIIYGWRSVAVQQKLVAEGRSKVRFSFHNAQTLTGIPNAWAADIVDKRWLWNEPNCMTFFKALGEEAKKGGLVWGGDWADFRDWAHIQGRQNSELSLVKRESGM